MAAASTPMQVMYLGNAAFGADAAPPGKQFQLMAIGLRLSVGAVHKERTQRGSGLKRRRIGEAHSAAQTKAAPNADCRAQRSLTALFSASRQPKNKSAIALRQKTQNSRQRAQSLARLKRHSCNGKAAKWRGPGRRRPLVCFVCINRRVRVADLCPKSVCISFSKPVLCV